MLNFLPLFVVVVGSVAAFRFIRSRGPDNVAYRLALGMSLTAGVLLFWINGAVGIIGSEDNDANLMFFGVLAVGLVGVLWSRFEPAGMARALLATAVAQALAAVVGIVGGMGTSAPLWPRDLLTLTGFFGTMWLGAAWLFQESGKKARSEPDA